MGSQLGPQKMNLKCRKIVNQETLYQDATIQPFQPELSVTHYFLLYFHDNSQICKVLQMLNLEWRDVRICFSSRVTYLRYTRKREPDFRLSHHMERLRQLSVRAMFRKLYTFHKSIKQKNKETAMFIICLTLKMHLPCVENELNARCIKWVVLYHCFILACPVFVTLWRSSG